MGKIKGIEINLLLLNTPKKEEDLFRFINIFRTSIRSDLPTFLGQIPVQIYQHFRKWASHKKKTHIHYHLANYNTRLRQTYNKHHRLSYTHKKLVIEKITHERAG